MMQFISDDDINESVGRVTESLPSDVTGYQQASKMYDSTFFEGENPVFVQKLAAALSQKYATYKNALWSKLAGVTNG